ncbi:hypothetical protein [Microbacterium sp. BR1]|uniref:hypothetical protein n=1 Tax=Microbacterium sp. BR1 TaxID=1070896 RepID=UPI0012FDDF8C|nr:hypothetical protein [Microbacterium sp. BR1]
MNVDVEPRKGRWSRLLLLAGGIGLAWCAATTLAQSSSASAAEDDPSGLLGIVSSTMQQTTSAATSVIDGAEPVVVDVVEAVTPPAPAAAPVPETPAPVVTPVIQGVANIATTVVSGVADTTTSALHGTADTVDVVSGTVAESTTGIVSGISVSQALAPLLAAIDELPILGTVTGELGVTETLGSAVSTVDALLTAVTGTATTIVGTPGHPATRGILPLPSSVLPGDATQPLLGSPGGSAATLTTQQALVFGGFFAGALIVGSIVPLVSASAPGSVRGGGWPLAPAGPSGAPAAISAAAAGAATLWAALVEFSWRSGPFGGAALTLSDDALPGAPVFATDVSPD